MSKRTVEQYEVNAMSTVKEIREELAKWPDDTVILTAEVFTDEAVSMYTSMSSSYIQLTGERVISQ